MNSNKNTEPKQQALTEINISETQDEPSSAYVSADGGPPRDQSIAPLWRSVIAVAVVCLVLVGFLAVMTIRQSGGQSSGISLVRTGAKASNSIVLVGSNGQITALRAGDGVMLWQLKAVMPTHITSTENRVMNIEVQDGVAFFTLGGGDVFAVHASDGSLIWRKSLGINLQSRLYVGNGLVVLWHAEEGAIVLRASDGTQLWTRQDDIPIGIAQGIVFVATQGADPRMYAIDGKTGKTLWMYDTTGSSVSVSADPTIAYIFVSGTYEPVTTGAATIKTPPYLVALHLSDGSLLWRQASPYNASLQALVTIGAQDIYVQTQATYVCTYRKTDGASISCTTDSLDRGQPISFVNGTVYIANNEIEQHGAALALQVGKLDPAKGAIQWLWQQPATTDGYAGIHIQGDVVVGLGATGVTAFRLSDGHLLWHALGDKAMVGDVATEGPIAIGTLP